MSVFWNKAAATALIVIVAVWLLILAPQYFAGSAEHGAYEYREKTELLYFWAGVSLAALALFSLIFAREHLRIAQKQHWTDIILKLDDRFENTEFAAQRGQAEKLMDAVEIAVKADLGIKDVLVPGDEVFEAIKRRMDMIISLEPPGEKDMKSGYEAAFQALNFCETLGFLWRQGFVRFDDIEGLFGGWIQKVYLAMEGEVRNLRNERDDPEILNNFSRLGAKAWVTRLQREGKHSQADALERQLRV